MGAAFEPVLALERIDDDIFRGRCHAGLPQTVFGGQVAAHALVAAGKTVPDDRKVHSLHGYFVRAGHPDYPILYAVERTKDGRSFSTRRVTAMQHGKAIFTLSASFHVPEQGFDHQPDMPDRQSADELPPRPERDRPGGGRLRESTVSQVLDLRSRDGGDPVTRTQQLWVRTREPLGDDPLLHVCALTYISDLSLARTASLPYRKQATMQITSLDHAVWFHRPCRADEWLLFSQHSTTAAGARGLVHGEFFSQDGRLVASVTQEVLMRPIGPPKG
ncbi:acyl-CoA thioesterase [Fodinicola acaciae]|uniref:acyl-CoA thioesterase n=1 Tax=Fodinicola acaciae TaxID=2681555 RepID=UPI0013D59C27|nr:acyl-CoA thioesterase II [Fodinicola acaciae]